jgi:hypothetical protein
MPFPLVLNSFACKILQQLRYARFINQSLLKASCKFKKFIMLIKYSKSLCGDTGAEKHIPFQHSPSFTLMYLASLSSSAGFDYTNEDIIDGYVTSVIQQQLSVKPDLQFIKSIFEAASRFDDLPWMDTNRIMSSIYHRFIYNQDDHDNPLYKLFTKNNNCKLEKLERSIYENDTNDLNELEKCFHALISDRYFTFLHENIPTVTLPILPPIPVYVRNDHPKQQWPPHMFLVNNVFLQTRKLDVKLQFSPLPSTENRPGATITVQQEAAKLSQYNMDMKTSRQELTTLITYRLVSRFYQWENQNRYFSIRERVCMMYHIVDVLSSLDRKQVLRSLELLVHTETVRDLWIRSIDLYASMPVREGITPSRDRALILGPISDKYTLTDLSTVLDFFLTEVLRGNVYAPLKEQLKFFQLQLSLTRIKLLLEEILRQPNQIITDELEKTMRTTLVFFEQQEGDSFQAVTANMIRFMLIWTISSVTMSSF